VELRVEFEERYWPESGTAKLGVINKDDLLSSRVLLHHAKQVKVARKWKEVLWYVGRLHLVWSVTFESMFMYVEVELNKGGNKVVPNTHTFTPYTPWLINPLKPELNPSV
jgi:hypothetical protein